MALVKSFSIPEKHKEKILRWLRSETNESDAIVRACLFYLEYGGKLSREGVGGELSGIRSDIEWIKNKLENGAIVTLDDHPLPDTGPNLDIIEASMNQMDALDM